MAGFFPGLFSKCLPPILPSQGYSMMKCSHPLKPLYQTAQGTVFRCRCCGWFNVLFGPVVLTHSRQGFRALCALIHALEPELDPALHVGARCYHLRTANRQIGLTFTEDEVDELRELLAGAAAMDELDGLIDDALTPHRNPTDGSC